MIIAVYLELTFPQLHSPIYSFILVSFLEIMQENKMFLFAEHSVDYFALYVFAANLLWF